MAGGKLQVGWMQERQATRPADRPTDSPVERDADENVSRKEESEDLEEGEDPAEDVARRPHHGGGVPDLQRHHQERHLQSWEEQR